MTHRVYERRSAYRVKRYINIQLRYPDRQLACDLLKKKRIGDCECVESTSERRSRINIVLIH